MKQKLFILLSLLVLASMMLAACGGTAAEPAPEEPGAPAPEEPAAPAPEEPAAPAFSGTATITFVQEPDNLNPMYTDMSFSGYLRPFYLKPSWDFDENGQPVPVLAKEIPSLENGGLTEDGLTVTIKLRDDITWSDGEPLTADDYVFTYDMIMSDKNVPLSRYPYEDYVTSVVAEDPATVVITFNKPFAAWLTSLFYWVLPKHVLQPVFDAEGTIDTAEWNRNPVPGLGPFVLDQWETGSHLAFKANPNWINPPKLEQVFVRIVPDDAAQEAAILAGDTDIGVFLSSDQIEKVEAGGTVKVVAVTSGYNEAWFLNVNPETAHPAMQDVNVRKAIALATDRFTIVKDLLVESINPVNVTYWDGTPPYQTDALKPYPYDPEEAKRLLDEAGWVDSNGDSIRDKDGVELVLRYITNQRELRKNVQAVVEQQWKLVGIGTELVNYSSDVFWNGYNDGGPQAQGLYEIAEFSSVQDAYPDPDASSGWTCDQITNADNPDGGNNQGYCNPEIDKLMAEQATTLDPVKRKEIYNQIQQIMYDDYIYIGMWQDPDLWSLSSRLQNVKFSGVYPFWNAYEWEINE
ncbi:MAG: peptide ABC transporter substrate-binding protein [Anaerolineales bacterium]|nr:peptide ABC transporter substrate-binding protein [Anaerolineales bacterium]